MINQLELDKEFLDLEWWKARNDIVCRDANEVLVANDAKDIASIRLRICADCKTSQKMCACLAIKDGLALVWDLGNRFYEKTIQTISENARIAQSNKESGTTATSIASTEQVKPAAAETLQNKVDTETVFLEYMKALNFKSGDVVCIGFGRDEKTLKAGESVWENFFERCESLTHPDAIRRLIARNDAGQNIYLSMAPFFPGTKSRVKKFVSGVRHVFIEKDEDGPETFSKIMVDVKAGLIPGPAIAVESSPGKLQAIWNVVPEGFIASNGGADVPKHESLIQTLRLRYNADPQSTDTARFLRIPGFRNNKYPDKPIARLLYVGDLTPHRLTDFKIEIVPVEEVANFPAVGDATVRMRMQYLDLALDELSEKGFFIDSNSWTAWSSEQGAYKREIVCFWGEEHSHGKTWGACFIVHASGRLDYTCRHAHCKLRRWREVREEMERIVGYTLTFGSADEIDNSTDPGLVLINKKDVSDPAKHPAATLTAALTVQPAADEEPAETDEDLLGNEPFPECPIFKSGSLVELAEALCPDVPTEFKQWALITRFGLMRSGLDKLDAQPHIQTRLNVVFVCPKWRGKTAAINESRQAMTTIMAIVKAEADKKGLLMPIAAPLTLTSVDSGPGLVDEFWDHYNKIKAATSDADQTSKILLDPDELSDTFEKAKVSAKSRNTLFSEFLKLHGGNRIANSSRQKGKRHLDNAHLAILAGTTVKKYPDLWTGTGGGGDGLQSRFTIIATNKGAMPIQQRPTAASSAFDSCVRIANQVAQPGQLITYSAPAWKAMNDWSKTIDLDSDAAARVSDMVHQLMIIMSVTNDLVEVPVSLMEQGLAWGDYEIAARKRLNPEDSWTWAQSQENAITAYYTRCRDWGDKAPKSMNEVRRAIHPQRKPGGLGPFLQAWKNLIGTGVLKLRNKGHKSLKYSIYA